MSSRDAAQGGKRRESINERKKEGILAKANSPRREEKGLEGKKRKRRQ